MTVQEVIEYLEQHGFIADEVKDMCIEALVQVEQYRALGTVEELKDAREKQVAKKPIHKEFELGNYYECPICGDITLRDYCGKCGQALKWGEEDEV